MARRCESLTDQDTLFQWRDGQAYYRNLRVDHESFEVGGRRFSIAGLQSAADLLDHEDFARKFIEDDRAPYGLELWPSAIMLAELIGASEDGGDRRALDLGCGLGLVSMVASLRAWRITAADHEPVSLRFARYNARQNKIAIDAFIELDWNTPPEGHKFHRIFAADVLYERINHIPILECIQKLLRPDGVALIVDPLRSIADGFEKLAVEHGFDTTVQPTRTMFRDRGEIKGRMFVLRLRVPSSA